MTVYIFFHDYGEIYGVYSTEEAAQSARNSLIETGQSVSSILSYEVTD